MVGLRLHSSGGLGLPAGLYPESVQFRDTAGSEATTDPQTLVVYDPSAGSVSGTGWIVTDPSVGDELPGIDGKAKAHSASERVPGLAGGDGRGYCLCPGDCIDPRR